MDLKTQDRLILHCLNMGPDRTELGELEKLSESDWDEIIVRLAGHRVAPLIYHRFRKTGIDTHIPAKVMQRLRTVYLSSAEDNIRIYHELSKVLGTLRDEGISVIVQKGAALAELIYQNIALRPMTDVDLLAKGKDALMIDKILPQLGYKLHNLLFSKRHIQWTHLEYTKETLLIEVHPSVIFELPNLDPWIKASPAKIASADMFVLGPEDFLLHTCLHLYRHLCEDRLSMLIWWYDIVQILKHYKKELDWDYTVRVARKNRVQGAMHHILRLINEWFNEPAPADIVRQLKSDGTIISMDCVLHPVQNPAPGQNDVLTQKLKGYSLLSYIPYISTIPSTYNKIYHIFRLVFPCREYMIGHYSIKRPNCVYFHYLIRIGKGAIKAMKALYQLPTYVIGRHVSS